MTRAVERPAIRLLHVPGAPAELVSAFEHGCEEEGVPVVTAVSASADAVEIARAAAQDSTLFIGAGIDVDGRIALHEQRIGDRLALLVQDAITPEIARGFGIAAGRIARGRPISDVVARDNM